MNIDKSSSNLVVKYLINCIIISLLLFFSFRSGGLDFDAYYYEFLDPVNNSVSSEIGYKFLLNLINPYFNFWFLLLCCNLVFYITHFNILNKYQSIDKAIIFLIYFVYLSLFLILGSPRRLIAYSIVAFVIYNVVIGRQGWIYFFLSILASLFHASSLILFPILVLSHYVRFSNNIKSIFVICFIFSFFCLFLYFSGVLDYIFVKFEYYKEYANEEQAYLSKVPSVWSGFGKRFIVIACYYFFIKNWVNSGKILFFMVTEISIYLLLGLVSPVLAVAATYFSIVYILPFICHEYDDQRLSHKLILGFIAFFYYFPTIYGLINLFGELYV